MTKPRRYRWLSLVVIAVLLGFGCLGSKASLAQSAGPPFRLPFTAPPGPSTWYVAQWYGNTIWAYRNWPDLYSEGQGLHFGIDFAAPCDTPVVSIGDGVVFAVDGPYGAPPHNLVINLGNGYFSLFGHLHTRPTVYVGEHVKRGQVVAYSGDPTGTCTEASHLHLEIRRTGMAVAVDPVPLINADWRALTIGADTLGSQFEVDLSNPARWQSNANQPEVQFGGAILNSYAPAWPPK